MDISPETPTVAQFLVSRHLTEEKSFLLSLVLGDRRKFRVQRLENSAFLQWVIYQIAQNAPSYMYKLEMRGQHGLELLTVTP